MKEFILSQDGETLKLPVNPSAFNDDQSHNNQRFQTYAVGEIKAIGQRNLREIAIESFFPHRYQSFCTYKDFPSPYECKAMIEKWKDSRKPIRLLITETNINFAYTIDSFACVEKDGTGDLYYRLELSEYRFLNVPASHNPAPIKKTTGLRERPKQAQKAVNKKKKARTRQAQKQIKKKQSESVPKSTLAHLESFRMMSDDLKKELDQKMAQDVWKNNWNSPKRQGGGSR